jgi:hypothetical protein
MLKGEKKKKRLKREEKIKGEFERKKKKRRGLNKE